MAAAAQPAGAGRLRWRPLLGETEVIGEPRRPTGSGAFHSSLPAWLSTPRRQPSRVPAKNSSQDRVASVPPLARQPYGTGPEATQRGCGRVPASPSREPAGGARYFFFSFLAARFSFNVLVGCFLSLFF